jgi:iron complex outermembrane receptor protein
MMLLKRWVTRVLLLVGATGGAFSAFAQEPPPAPAAPGSLEEIVVTAQKREESVQTVPISVTVVSEEQLTRAGVSTMSDLSRSSASLEFGAPGTSSPGGGGYVRGIGTNSFGFTAQPSVGIVLDGVVMGNTNILSLFDISRVEVLKGPQGTLFGNSVSAGVINITTNAPDPTAKAFAFQTEYGADELGSDYSRFVVRGTANLPINDWSALRLAVHSDRDSGLMRNVWLGVDSKHQDNGVRVRYLANPNDNLKIDLIADYNHVDETNPPVLLYRVAPAGSPLEAALADCGVKAGEDNFENCSEKQDFSQERTRGFSAAIDYDFGSTTLTSISSYRGRNTSTRGDIQSIPYAISRDRFAQFVNCFFVNCVGIYKIQPGYGPTGPQEHDKTQFSQELRLASNPGGKLDWVIGAFYLDYKDEIEEGGLINAFFTGNNDAPTGQFATVKTNDYAGFANLTWHFTDALTGILGARYTHSKVSEKKTDISNPPPDRYLEVTASKPSYRVGMQYQFTPAVMTYATIASGYKGPQISDAFDNGGTLFGVDPEIPTSYEIGINTSAFDNRLAVNADVFYTDVQDYQGQSCSPNSQGTITCVPTNVSGVKTKGVELDIFGQPVPGLSLNLNAIYNPAEYPDGYLSSDGLDLGGTQLTRSSKTKVSFSAEYAANITDTTQFVIGADAVYRSEQSLYPSPAEQFIVDDTILANARVGLRFGEDWSVYLFGRNLGDEQFPRDLFPTPFNAGGLWQVYDTSSRKLIGVQLNANF